MGSATLVYAPPSSPGPESASAPSLQEDDAAATSEQPEAAAAPPSRGKLSAEKPPPPPPPSIPDLIGEGDALPLGLYAERAYLEYAVSVVKGRALPDVCDGQKPVQRRILYAMHELGLSPTSKPVKSARVVGDVIGKYHPHGDQAAYDAMVRLAQGFTVRYPLVDGQGNFGSRDGDGAAAMRYTEARLTPFASLLLSELDRGTVDFIPNYDGADKEPALLPARLPVVLLNGASGIAVGMATEIPPHNLHEVARAAAALVESPDMTVADIMEYIQGPDYPGGGQIISPSSEIQAAYESGRGTLKVRARWKFEEMARGQWQVVVHELPPGTSAQKVLEEIEELTSPKLKTGKKSLTHEQNQTKQLILSMLDAARDESDKEQSVRLVFEPKTSKIDRNEFVKTLLAYTSMECTAPLNMVMIGRDGRPRQKSLKDILAEWVDFRYHTVRRRTQFRLDQVLDRIHVLEGRLIVFLNVDDVIHTIRESDDPKQDLIARFRLSDRQAEDILEIRLRQLARLEGIKIEQELEKLRNEQQTLEHLMGDERAMRRAIVKEIEADAKTFGDPRRTLIEETERTVLSVNVVDEPLTILLSEKGWIRSRNGHNVDLEALSFKDGDSLRDYTECRSVEPLVFIASDGRAFSVPAGSIPGGRGDGIPVTTLVELQGGARLVHMLSGSPDQDLLLSTSGSYGFTCKMGDLASRLRAGKQFLNVDSDEIILRPVPWPPPAPTEAMLMPVMQPELLVAALSSNGRLLCFPLSEMKSRPGGGRGVIIMGLDHRETLVDIGVVSHTLEVHGLAKGSKYAECKLTGDELTPFVGHRASKGRLAPFRIEGRLTTVKVRATGLKAW